MRIGCQVTRRPAPTSWYSKMVTIDLSGQSALVTGGIGGQICVRLAEAGAHVDVYYRNGEQHAAGVVDQIRRSGGSARAVAADLSESADIDPAIVSLNEGIKDARAKLTEAQRAAEENWAAVNDELTEAIDRLRQELVGSEA